MAQVGRLAGAILARSGAYFLVGNLKEPCDWAAAGFEQPAQEIDALLRPFVRLQPVREVAIATPRLELALEGDALPRLLTTAFVIDRTGMISERLWRLVIGESDEHECPRDAVIDADWLATTPAPIWTIVRDAVLRCS